MLFVLRPTAQATSSRPVYFDPEEAFLEFKRREYIAALEEQQQRSQFERELELEQERHRRALETIKAQEAARRRQQAYSSYSRSPYSPYGVHPAHLAQASKAQAGCGTGGARFCHQPAPEEILRRRAARQQEEERLSRQFHEHILSQIFGIPVEKSEESAASTTAAAPEAAAQPKASTCAKGKGKENDTPAPAAAPKRTRFEDEATEPHWSAAPERAQSLAEIASVNRNFVSLKNTFIFPTGHLEGVKGSDVPRLAYNEVNATIHAYDHALSELLTRLDSIESHGFKGVREARKQLVVKIEKELEELEKKIAERLAGDASPAAPFVSIPVEGPSGPSSPITSTSASTSTVVPAVPTSPVLAPAAVTASNDDDIVMDEPQAQVQPSAPAAEKAALGGYDVEFEDDYEAAARIDEEFKDAPVAEPVIEQSNEQVLIEVDQDAQEPEQPIEPSTETTPVEVSASTPSPAPQTTVHTAVLAEAEPTSTSDEESEIEDAVHIEISSGEENVHAASDKDDHHSDEDGAFEML